MTPTPSSITNATIMADFAVGRCGLTRDDTQLWLADLRRLGAERCYFFSLNRYLFTANKPTR
ncbi:MAG TPA: hypothetical protein VF995_10115 [Actinomycetota bacterium]